MDSSPDNFDSLQKLLRLKRYELPPPRYFNEFSSQVLARIEAGEARAAAPWWQRFGVDIRPIVTFAAGTAACCLLFFSVGFSFDDGQGASVGAPVTFASHATPTDAFAGASTSDTSSTNPINPAGAMMLDAFRAKVHPTTATY